MTITFICIDLDRLCRYSGILSHCYSIISVTCIIDAVSLIINAYNYTQKRNQQNGNMKSEIAMRLNYFFV